MYQNVYLHKTTRGFEQLLQAMWKRAKQIRDDGSDAKIVPTIEAFWKSSNPTTEQYLAIEEFTVLSQIQVWQNHPDRGLSDLASRFLGRRPFFMLEPPAMTKTLIDVDVSGWENELLQLIDSHSQYQPSWMYCLVDRVKPKYHQPYFPEKESDEQSVKNAIRIVGDDDSCIEVSRLLPRLRPLTEQISTTRYYIPHEVKTEALRLRGKWESEHPS